MRASPVSLKSIAVLGHVSSPFYVRCLVLLFFLNHFIYRSSNLHELNKQSIIVVNRGAQDAV